MLRQSDTGCSAEESSRVQRMFRTYFVELHVHNNFGNFGGAQPTLPGPEEMQKLYEEWLSSNEQWQSSSYVIQLQQSHKFTKLGARRWMTFREISAKYSSDEIAQSIVDEKKANRQLAATQIKKHPDCPKREETQLPNGNLF